jgi:undecaprenyl-diphosphatase
VNEFLIDLDRNLFYFCNQGLRNWVFDVIFPFLTDLNKKPVALILAGILWILLLTKGGRHGRIAALLLVPTIVLSDQLNSSFFKFVIERPRPCHELANVHLLVSCGSGYSFPSSHAVNNFSAAIVLAYFLPKWFWTFFSFAALIAFSRVYVGVHYPSDVVGGAVVGLAIGGAVIIVFRFVEEWWNRRRHSARTVRR